MVISYQLRSLRDLFGYSQKGVAYELGISQPAYSKIEKGITKLSWDMLEKLATLYEVDPDVLLSLRALRPTEILSVLVSSDNR